MKRLGLISLSIFTLSLFFGSVALAQQKEVEIDGLIIDRTQTKIGLELYQNFVTFWEAPEGIKDYNILIAEMASPAWGSLVWIEVGDLVGKETVYQGILKPRPEEIEEAAKKGCEIVKEYLYRLEEYGKEATGRDMAGNGVY